MEMNRYIQATVAELLENVEVTSPRRENIFSQASAAMFLRESLEGGASLSERWENISEEDDKWAGEIALSFFDDFMAEKITSVRSFFFKRKNSNFVAYRKCKRVVAVYRGEATVGNNTYSIPIIADPWVVGENVDDLRVLVSARDCLWAIYRDKKFIGQKLLMPKGCFLSMDDRFEYVEDLDYFFIDESLSYRGKPLIASVNSREDLGSELSGFSFAPKHHPIVTEKHEVTRFGLTAAVYGHVPVSIDETMRLIDRQGETVIHSWVEDYYRPSRLDGGFQSVPNINGVSHNFFMLRGNIPMTRTDFWGIPVPLLLMNDTIYIDDEYIENTRALLKHGIRAWMRETKPITNETTGEHYSPSTSVMISDEYIRSTIGDPDEKVELIDFSTSESIKRFYLSRNRHMITMNPQYVEVKPLIEQYGEDAVRLFALENCLEVNFDDLDARLLHWKGVAEKFMNTKNLLAQAKISAADFTLSPTLVSMAQKLRDSAPELIRLGINPMDSVVEFHDKALFPIISSHRVDPYILEAWDVLVKAFLPKHYGSGSVTGLSHLNIKTNFGDFPHYRKIIDVARAAKPDNATMCEVFLDRLLMTKIIDFYQSRVPDEVIPTLLLTVSMIIPKSAYRGQTGVHDFGVVWY